MSRFMDPEAFSIEFLKLYVRTNHEICVHVWAIRPFTAKYSPEFSGLFLKILENQATFQKMSVDPYRLNYNDTN